MVTESYVNLIDEMVTSRSLFTTTTTFHVNNDNESQNQNLRRCSWYLLILNILLRADYFPKLRCCYIFRYIKEAC